MIDLDRHEEPKRFSHPTDQRRVSRRPQTSDTHLLLINRTLYEIRNIRRQTVYIKRPRHFPWSPDPTQPAEYANTTSGPLGFPEQQYPGRYAFAYTHPQHGPLRRNGCLRSSGQAMWIWLLRLEL